MKPVLLEMYNFGPFIEEKIDFKQVNQDQLFLISGKTGSGKTMIFDAMTYALYGEASTKDRAEGDLRSHFAVGKSPMQVSFEFKLGEKYFKVMRQGSFIKEGNKTQTQGKLAVYEWEDEQYELRESKIKDGDDYIKSLLGVNAEQFRQLFILPQGEFKRFLLSSSSDKQKILRTLFNSERFEAIQQQLSEDIKQIRNDVEKYYDRLKHLLSEIADFEDETLKNYKEVEVDQTDKLSVYLGEFETKAEQISQSLTQQKNTQQQAVTQFRKQLDHQRDLVTKQQKLEQVNQDYQQLMEEKPNIEKLQKLLTEMLEVKPLAQLIETQENNKKRRQQIDQDIQARQTQLKKLQQELETLEQQYDDVKQCTEEIEEKESYIKRTTLFYNKLSEYETIFNSIDTLIENKEKAQREYHSLVKETTDLEQQINNRQPDHEKVGQLTEDIYELNDQIKTVKQSQDLQKQLKIDIKRRDEQQNKTSTIERQITDLQHQIDQFDTSQLDLTNKKDMITTLQAALHEGETCPICGSEIHHLEGHIDFENIRTRKKELEQLEHSLQAQREYYIKATSELESLNEKINEATVDLENDYDTTELEQQLSKKQQQKNELTEFNRIIQQQLEQKQNLEKSMYQLKYDIAQQENEIKQSETKQNDFKATTQCDDTSAFKQAFQQYEKQINEYHQRIDQLEKAQQQHTQQINNHMSQIEFLTTHLEEVEQHMTEGQANIEQEMARSGFETQQQVEQTIAKLDDKEVVEAEINQFNKNKQQLELQMEQLKKDLADQMIEDIEALEHQFNDAEQQLEQYTKALTEHDYKAKENARKIKDIRYIIDALNDDLKSQKEVFQLAEILAGDNSQKLTLENFVLIYYLNRILTQANHRLAIMTGERYQLQRRKQVSRGYSGLEIEVFDGYTNKSRHITSLSGGETFQASLALALGLSEIVQQESGGVTLESMFIDEGFGTLDQETLETAIDTLVGLKSAGRMVGVISHVSELKQRINLILEVSTDQYQSHVRFEHH
ncbi:exonuclease subunit SbcC [Staphylococcus auricularis]|uniref:exonuclease subunit SbcC n=1 Tax=Staphylococcus auricularis TaxID=29379 RepID=UPI002DBE53F1|nr:exonuclease subunit SbcC [Staphylococcus auricularis]MEB6569492.1 SMC family ATPase [Staphylococcus auricularis]